MRDDLDIRVGKMHINGMNFRAESVSHRRRITKRIFDVVLSLLGLIGSLPLWVIISLAIYLEDGWSIFYVQERIGKSGRIFKICKFRSMIKNAEQMGNLWTEENDLRITKAGRILRVTAMDELPQLINIIKGDMSFVGPRSERPELAEKFSKEISNYNLCLSVRPGLTGVAQIYGSYDTPPHQKYRYDLFYIQKQSFGFDLKLILLSLWITSKSKWEHRGRKF